MNLSDEEVRIIRAVNDQRSDRIAELEASNAQLRAENARLRAAVNLAKRALARAL